MPTSRESRRAQPPTLAPELMAVPIPQLHHVPSAKLPTMPTENHVLHVAANQGLPTLFSLSVPQTRFPSLIPSVITEQQLHATFPYPWPYISKSNKPSTHNRATRNVLLWPRTQFQQVTPLLIQVPRAFLPGQPSKPNVDPHLSSCSGDSCSLSNFQLCGWNPFMVSFASLTPSSKDHNDFLLQHFLQIHPSYSASNDCRLFLLTYQLNRKVQQTTQSRHTHQNSREEPETGVQTPI